MCLRLWPHRPSSRLHMRALCLAALILASATSAVPRCLKPGLCEAPQPAHLIAGRLGRAQSDGGLPCSCLSVRDHLELVFREAQTELPFKPVPQVLNDVGHAEHRVVHRGRGRPRRDIVDVDGERGRGEGRRVCPDLREHHRHCFKGRVRAARRNPARRAKGLTREPEGANQIPPTLYVDSDNLNNTMG